MMVLTFWHPAVVLIGLSIVLCVIWRIKFSLSLSQAGKTLAWEALVMSVIVCFF